MMSAGFDAGSVKTGSSGLPSAAKKSHPPADTSNPSQYEVASLSFGKTMSVLSSVENAKIMVSSGL
jgi:hypothetical protein